MHDKGFCIPRLVAWVCMLLSFIKFCRCSLFPDPVATAHVQAGVMFKVAYDVQIATMLAIVFVCL